MARALVGSRFLLNGPKCFIVFLFQSFLLAPPFLAVQDDECRDYRGDLNKKEVVRLCLCEKNGALSGLYFYKKDLKDIHLRGEPIGERRILLRELDSQGAAKGSFTLEYLEKDPRGGFGGQRLNKEVLVGSWNSADGTQVLPAYFSIQFISQLKHETTLYQSQGPADSALIERNAQSFYFAVLNRDKTTAARLIQFPLAFNFQGKRKLVWNRTAFLRYYDRIFTSKFLAEIKDGEPHHMRANWQGIMLAQGAIWFDYEGKVQALNN